MKRNIGIDLDDTCWNFYEPFILDYNQKFGTNLNPKKFEEYNFAKFLGIEAKEALTKFFEFEKNNWNKILFFEDFERNFPELAQKNNIFFITARNILSKNFVVHRLDSLQQDYSLYFSKTEENPELPSKLDYCKNKNIDYMVEDNKNTAENLSQNGINVILLERPWNVGYKKFGVINAKNWDSVIKILK